MRKRQVWSLPEQEGQQMQSPGADSKHLENFVLSKVAPDLFATQTKEVDKLRNLISIARGQDDIISTRFELASDGDEKRDVRRVVGLDPNSLFVRSCGL